jgi:hypothetical protein
MDVLALFRIDPVAPLPAAGSVERTQIVSAFLPIKTWNVERAQRIYRPGIVLADNPDNADIAGPDSVYDYYV